MLWFYNTSRLHLVGLAEEIPGYHIPKVPLRIPDVAKLLRAAYLVIGQIPDSSARTYLLVPS